MRWNVLTVARGFRAAALCVLIASVAGVAIAQSPQPADPDRERPAPRATPSPAPSQERRFLKDIVRDQRAIWTSPFHLKRDDARWLAPLSVSTFALMASDQETGELSDSRRRASVSKEISFAGSIYSTGGFAPPPSTSSVVLRGTRTRGRPDCSEARL